MSIEPTQADRDAAFNTGLRLTKEEWLVLYDAFARHRLASTPASGEVVAWEQMHDDLDTPILDRTALTAEQKADGWTETPLCKCAAPSHPAAEQIAESAKNAADLVEAADAMASSLKELVGEDLCGDVNPDNWKWETAYYRPVISWAMRHRARAALSRYAKGGA